MDSNQFKTELHRLAVSEVAKSNYSFSREADEQLINIISEGVDRMGGTGRTSEVDMAIARLHMRELCKMLVERETSIYIVESRTFSATRFSICPLWPFC